MLNKKKSLFINGLSICFYVSFLVLVLTSIAQGYTGKVIDIFGADITTIQLDGKHSIEVGDKIDLTYMAGMLPMAIGIYEITAVQNDVILSKPVSTTMPADKGMKVEFDVVNRARNKTPPAKKKQKRISLLGQEFIPDQPNPAAMEPASRDIRYNNSVPVQKVSQKDFSVKIQGKVIEVMGTDVRIKLASSGKPKKGFAADLIYVISNGTELQVGTWKVSSVNNREVIASALDKNAKPRVGMKALIYMKNEKIGRQKELSPGVVLDEDGFPVGKGLFEQVEPIVDTSEKPSLNKEKSFNFNKKASWDLLKDRKYLLGVEMANCSKVPNQRYSNFSYGVILISVKPDSAAQRGGLKKGDMVYVIDGKRVKNAEHFIQLINSSSGKVKLEIQRAGRKRIKRIKLDKM